jgi:hypothetical protein
MSEGFPGLYGRNRAIALVREFMERPEVNGYPTTRRTPIVIFTGPRGSGKSALLDGLGRSVRDNVPYARINCGRLKSAAAWKVLPLLAFELNRNAAGYRSIPFPRFVTAQVAIAAQLDSVGPTANQQIREALTSNRRVDKLRTFLDRLAQDMVGAVPVVGGMPGAATAAQYTADLLLDGLVSWRRGRRVVLGEGLEWYGSGGKAYAELIRLNRLTRDDADEAEHGEATELLWAAFLADLRAAFGKGRGARTWSLNCVLMLDDVDSEPGLLLYSALADARRLDVDPLTVVATSAGSVAGHVAPDGEIPFADEAGYEDYLVRRQGDDEQGSYPVALRDLTLDEINEMVTDLSDPRLGTRRGIATMVYRFTHGHPATTAAVVNAIGNHAGDTTSLARLLESRWRGPVNEASVTVGERLLNGLLDSKDLASLEVCSAARDLEQGDELARSGLIPQVRGDNGLVPRELRLQESSTGRVVMLPVLRHLLLRGLAATPERWTAVHTWLRDNGREADRSYHALALRDVGAVVQGLTGLLGDSRAWLAELDSVTVAPSDLGTDESDPVQILATAGYAGSTDERAETTARLVAALWTANDPLSAASRSDLCESASEDLKTLAQQAGAARHDLMKAVGRLKAEAKKGYLPRPTRTPPRSTQAPPPDAGGFLPQVPEGERRRRRIRAIAVVTVLTLLAGFAIVATAPVLRRCAAGVHKHAGECVGFTDGSYVFNEQLAAVQRLIQEENERVEKEPHVTVALFTPLLATGRSSVSWQRVLAQLEGAYAAQKTANDQREPKVRLVLANPGSAQQEWHRVVGQLVESVDEERLVGVIGVGQSTANTRETARALSAADIPMVASVVTATDFAVEPPGGPGEQVRYIEGFTRVSSTTGNQIAVLSDYLAGKDAGKAMLVHDISDDDLYTSTLHHEFSDAAEKGKLSITVKGRFDTEALLGSQFDSIVGDLCSDEALKTVLYAGRAVLLDDLIGRLRDRRCARERLITLVTGSDASMLRTREDLRPEQGQADLAILYTPHVDLDAVADIPEFERLTTQFERLGFDPDDLADGWGVMMHDAMLAMSEAISRSANGLKRGEVPTRQAVRAELGRAGLERNTVRGAGGPFTIDAATGNALGRRLPIMEVDKNGTFHVRDIVDVPR